MRLLRLLTRRHAAPANALGTACADKAHFGVATLATFITHLPGNDASQTAQRANVARVITPSSKGAA